MKIGVIADTHDNIPKIKKALALFKKRECGIIIHAGDVIAPFAAKALKAAKIPIYAVYGNNDGEKKGLKDLLDIVDGPRVIKVGERKIVVAHSEAQVTDAHREGADLVIVGHTHIAQVRRDEKPLFLNPGEAGGWLYGKTSVAVVDTGRMAIEEVSLD
jgi:putative phosphoesterase